MDKLRKFMLNEIRKITVRKGSNIKAMHCVILLQGNTINGNVTERDGRLRVIKDLWEARMEICFLMNTGSSWARNALRRK